MIDGSPQSISDDLASSIVFYLSDSKGVPSAVTTNGSKPGSFHSWLIVVDKAPSMVT